MVTLQLRASISINLSLSVISVPFAFGCLRCAPAVVRQRPFQAKPINQPCTTAAAEKKPMSKTKATSGNKFHSLNLHLEL